MSSDQDIEYYIPNFVSSDINSNDFPKPVKFFTMETPKNKITKSTQELPNNDNEAHVNENSQSNEWLLYRKAKKYYNKIKGYIGYN